MANNRLLARVARHHGGKLLDRALDKVLPLEGGTGAVAAKPSLSRKLANAALLRIAMRSVPGAILVGGGLIAKRLHERHKAGKAAAAASPGKNPAGKTRTK